VGRLLRPALSALTDVSTTGLDDTGERILPTAPGEVSVVFAQHLAAYDYAEGFVVGKDVLDVGCGTGYGTHRLAGHARRALGIDYSEEAVAYCRRTFQAPNLEYRMMDANRITLDRTFDVGVTFQVIEHMVDPEVFLRSICSALKPGGTLIITTPNVQTPHPEDEKNHFHFSEMNYDGLAALLGRVFDEFRILGIDHEEASGVASGLRALARRLPFYTKLGLLLGRRSRIKQMAVSTMGLTRFRVVSEAEARQAGDLLAVCTVR